MDLYAQLRAVDDAVREGKLTLLDLYDNPLIRQAFGRYSRAQMHTALVRDREAAAPVLKPKPKPVRQQRRGR